MPYCRPFNYPEYVQDSDLDAHVKVFKVAIRAYDDIEDVKIINLFSFTLRDTISDWCNNYMGDYLGCIFAKLQLTFYKQFRIVQNDEQVYLQLKNMKQEKNERLEVYYERLLKLTNSLQHRTINSFLTIIFRYGLQPYLHAATIGMKREIL
jgi:hypothetical protein